MSVFSLSMPPLFDTLDSPSARTNRRTFLKLSAAGAAALSTISLGAGLAGCGSEPVSQGMRVLRDSDQTLLRAMIPAVMAGKIAAQDQEAVEETLHSFDTLMADLSPSVIDVVRQAFDALSFAPTRIVLAGQWSTWANASTQDAQDALDKLRDSSLGLSNAVYAAMIRLIASAYYLMPRAAAATGYPGPPQKAIAG